MLRVAVGAALGVILATVGAWAQRDIRPNITYGSDPTQRLDLCMPAANVPVGPRW